MDSDFSRVATANSTGIRYTSSLRSHSPTFNQYPFCDLEHLGPSLLMLEQIFIRGPILMTK